MSFLLTDATPQSGVSSDIAENVSDDYYTGFHDELKTTKIQQKHKERRSNKPNFYLKRRFEEEKTQRLKRRPLAIPSIKTVENKLLTFNASQFEIEEPSDDIFNSSNKINETLTKTQRLEISRLQLYASSSGIRDLGASQISELGNFYNKEKEEEIALPNLK